ncbi:MAG: TULIP family P47-like protein [Pseudomonadota bacterium]
MPNPDLFGWDTVFALPLAAFNLTLASPAVPAPMQYSFAASGHGPADHDLAWSFGPWQVEDATGAQFTLTSQLLQASLTGATGACDLSGGLCRVTANLVMKATSDADPAEAPSPEAPAEGEPWAVVDLEAPQTADFASSLIAQQGLAAWFATQAASKAFDAIFAGLQVRTADRAQAAKLKVLASRLAGATLPDQSQAIAVLARTATDSVTGCPLELSPFALPPKAGAVFLISAERLLATMIAPALPHVFGSTPGDAASDFPVLDDCRIRNTTPLSFPVTTADGKIYQAAIAAEDLCVEVADDVIVITLQMSFGIQLGALPLETITIRTVERLKASLVSPPDDPDHLVLALAQATDPVAEYDTEESLWAIGGEALVTVVASIVAALILKFVPGGISARFGLSMISARIWAAVLAGVAEAIGSAISHLPDFMASVTTSDLKSLPAFSQLIDQALADIEWPTPQLFAVESVELAGCLRVGLKQQTIPNPK